MSFVAIGITTYAWPQGIPIHNSQGFHAFPPTDRESFDRHNVVRLCIWYADTQRTFIVTYAGGSKGSARTVNDVSTCPSRAVLYVHVACYIAIVKART